ncbi:MAG: sigma-70 family RNA polymerase sigma factor [Paracoccaceae bacterium]
MSISDVACFTYRMPLGASPERRDIRFRSRPRNGFRDVKKITPNTLHGAVLSAAMKPECWIFHYRSGAESANYRSAMVDERTSDELIAAVATGDRAAFRALYDQYGAKLFGVCLRICLDRSVAEDAVQDTFVEIWRKAADFDSERGRAGAWMAVIARNRAIDTIRRRGRSPGWGSRDGVDHLALIADPQAREDGGADMMALNQCLSRLEDGPRRMLVLAYVEGLSREELSQRFDAPVNTIKTWLRRGLAALKTCLDG